MNITIGFTTSNDVVSKTIRWVTKSECSHALIEFDVESLSVRLILQAFWTGFEIRPKWRWDQKNKTVATFKPVGPDVEGAFVNMLEAHVGSFYDYKAALFVGLRDIFGRWFRGKFQSPKKLMCSESVVRMLLDAGYKSVKNLDPETTSPGDLLKVLRENPQEFKEV